MSEFVFIYSTFPNASSAAAVAEALVRAKLAACVNITTPITSIYEWEGKIQTAPEIAVLIKTRRALADEAIAAARPLHPYSLPCFVVLPVEGGLEDYLNWVRAQTLGEAL